MNQRHKIKIYRFDNETDEPNGVIYRERKQWMDLIDWISYCTKEVTVWCSDNGHNVDNYDYLCERV